MTIPDCTVIGASVTGCTAAKALAENGKDVLLLSDKIGKNGKCTAIVSRHGLEKTGLNYKPTILNDIYGAVFHSGNEHFQVKSSTTQAYVLDRFALDKAAFDDAINAGAKFKKQHVTGKPQAVRVIGADGVSSTTAKLYGFPPLEKIIVGYEVEFSNAIIADKKKVDVFLDYPGLFGWIVPVNEETVRIGLATDTNLDIHKKKFFNLPEVSATINKAKKIREFTHAIPVKPRGITQKKNCMLVGDAAGQTKATTGGGIVFGCLCAKIAAECIIENKNYEKEWRARYGHQLKTHYYARKILDNIPDQMKPLMLKASEHLGLPWLLENFGDMDFFINR